MLNLLLKYISEKIINNIKINMLYIYIYIYIFFLVDMLEILEIMWWGLFEEINLVFGGIL